MKPTYASSVSKVPVSASAVAMPACTSTAAAGTPRTLRRDSHAQAGRSRPISSMTLGPARTIALMVEISAMQSSALTTRAPPAPNIDCDASAPISTTPSSSCSGTARRNTKFSSRYVTVTSAVPCTSARGSVRAGSRTSPDR